MRKLMKTLSIVTILCMICMGISACERSADSKDREFVDKQQSHYSKVQPVPFFDYSIPRDVLIQIYKVVTQEARSTYTVIESVTGVTKFRGPSIGYGIPADTSLTNPLKPTWHKGNSPVIHQAEPNGLYSSQNTDGTWVLFVEPNGDIVVIYTEHKVTTFPFAVKKTADGEWVRADNKKAAVTINLDKIKRKLEAAIKAQETENDQPPAE